MATFVWKGRTLGGEMQSGELDAGKREEAIELLRKRKIMVTALNPKGTGFALPKFGGTGIGTKDLAI
ncbi:MAG: hypothetical protein E6K80_05845, partial [Candidatus Eisenbacteria bacterium]